MPVKRADLTVWSAAQSTQHLTIVVRLSPLTAGQVPAAVSALQGLTIGPIVIVQIVGAAPGAASDLAVSLPCSDHTNVGEAPVACSPSCVTECDLSCSRSRIPDAERFPHSKLPTSVAQHKHGECCDILVQ